MKYRLRSDHAVTCEADVGFAEKLSAIVFDDKPLRCIPLEEFQRDWEEAEDGDLFDSPFVRMEKLKAVANAARLVVESSTEENLDVLRKSLSLVQRFNSAAPHRTTES